jgi:hypothetical protein
MVDYFLESLGQVRWKRVESGHLAKWHARHGNSLASVSIEPVAEGIIQRYHLRDPTCYLSPKLDTFLQNVIPFASI